MFIFLFEFRTCSIKKIMEKVGLFRFSVVSSNGVSLVSYPKNSDLENDALEIISKLDLSLPISVVEKSNLVFTSQINNFAVFLVATDPTVDADSCGDFLSSLKKKWISIYGREEITQNDIKDNSFETFMKDLLEDYNLDRKEEQKSQTHNENDDDNEPVPEIILDEGRQTPIRITEIEDPKTSREKPLLGRDGSTEIHIHEENNELPLTFPQEHFDEALASLRLKICWQRYKCVIIILILIILVCIVAIFFLCGGFSFDKCFNTKKK